MFSYPSVGGGGEQTIVTLTTISLGRERLAVRKRRK